MVSFRYIRRRRVSLVKLLLICFAVIGVLFWFYRVRTGPDELPSERKQTFVFPRSSGNHRQNHIEIHRKSENVAPVIERYPKSGSSFRNPALLHKLRAKTSDALNQNAIKDNSIKLIGSSELGMPVMKVTPGLGEGGVPVHLSQEEQLLADQVFNSAAFNVYLSDRISLNRSVPDPRNPK